MMTTTTVFLNPTILTNVNIPNTVTGYPSIDWTINNNTITENNYAISSKPLHTISGLWMEKFLSTTSELYCTGYNSSYTESQLLLFISEQIIPISQGYTGTLLYDFLRTIDPTSGFRYGDINNTGTITAADGRVWFLLSEGSTSLLSWWNNVVKPAFLADTVLQIKVQIAITGYSIQVPGLTQVAGIELALNVQRAGRIQDLKIKLVLNGVEIANGNNLASTINPVQSNMYTGDNSTVSIPLGNYNIYGGSLSTWGVNLTSAQIADPTFGVVVSFHSNQIYPHTDLVYLSQAALRVTYA
jgi:hypothetical protein